MPRIRRARALREHTTPQLLHELADASRQLYNQRFVFATQQVGDVKEIRNLRKEIARMRTILRERELAGEDLSEVMLPSPEEPPSGEDEEQAEELDQSEEADQQGVV